MNLKPLLLLGLLCLAAPSPGTAGEARLQVVVSILPQQYWVERIGGDRVEVLTLVQPGDNEATYSPGPATLAALDGARAWFTMGVHFENTWLARITRDRPGMEVIALADGLPLRQVEQSVVKVGRGHAHDHDHAGMPDPHTWTDPRLAAQMVARIAAALARLDPQGAELYLARSAALQGELLALHEEIAAKLAPVRGRAFIVFHPSWGYFADAYGLVQLPIEVSGREPGPRGLAEVIKQGREAGVRAVFVQQQFSQRSARAVAEALGAAVVEADPLAPDHIENLREVAARMAEALADAPGGAAP
jgi:zinc transport system substrate-binding protein